MKRIGYLLTASFLLLPLLTIGYLSVTTLWTFPKQWQGPFTMQYWSGLFQSGNALAASLALSLGVSITIAGSATVFGFVVSKQLAFGAKTGRLLRLAYFPYLIAPVVFGSMLQFYFVRLGLTGSIAGVWLAQVLFVFPYGLLFLSTFWNDRLKQTAFQATTLGASNWQLYRSVLIPMARPWLFICFVQCFLISWFEYGITQLIGVGKVPTLTIRTMQYVREADPHQAALASCLMVLPVLLLLVVNQRLFLKRVDPS